MNRNRNDRQDAQPAPRSLLRDRPLAEPLRHRHTPLQTMNGNFTQQPRQQTTQATPRSIQSSTTTTVTTPSEITTSRTIPPVASSTSSPGSPTSPSGKKLLFLPSIDESRSEVVFRQTNNAKKQNRNGSWHSQTSLAPSLALSCDSSDESFSNLSSHSLDSTSSGSDSSLDYEFENCDDDNEISCSIRSSQSMPPLRGISPRKGGTISSTRRTSTPDLYKRSRSFQVKTPPYRPSSISAYSDSLRRMAIPPPPFAKQSRSRSYPPITKPYTSTTSSISSTTKSSSTELKGRMQFLASFFLSGVGLQLFLLLGIAILVVWSRTQAAFASDTLLRLKETESMGLLKLHRLESHSMHIHELMRNRILRESGRSKDTDDAEDLSDGEDPPEAIDHRDDPLLGQYQQLSRLATDLRKHADITTLQSTLQETAIDEIVGTYGEGPVKVVVELDFADKKPHVVSQTNNRKTAQRSTISIILWPDTPHAAWTLLEQIQRSLWDGSFVKLNPTSTALQFGPTKDDPEDRGHLEFVESHPPSDARNNGDFHHGAWTIGLREAISEDHSKSNLEMFINLADNSEERKHETCIGKIFDGFDTLQRLLEGVEITPNGNAKTNVAVKTVRAMHMNHHELEQIYR